MKDSSYEYSDYLKYLNHLHNSAKLCKLTNSVNLKSNTIILKHQNNRLYCAGTKRKINGAA